MGTSDETAIGGSKWSGDDADWIGELGTKLENAYKRDRSLRIHTGGETSGAASTYPLDGDYLRSVSRRLARL